MLLVRALAAFHASALPYVPGSSISLAVDGIPAPFDVDAYGPIAIANGYATLPLDAHGDALLVAGNGAGIAEQTLQIAAPPTGDIVAVAAYDDGIVFHDPRTLQAESLLGIRGAPAGVAIDATGTLATADTTFDGAVFATQQPWSVRRVSGVPVVDDVAFGPNGTLYATNRDPAGHGTLTAVAPDGSRRSVQVGMTPEGVVVTRDGSRVYTANTNDGTISIVDTASMREIARKHVADRIFSLALSSDERTLYATSNQSVTSMFARAGGVVAVDARTLAVRTRSAPLEFPLGVALDDRRHRLFVTDESASVVYVLDERTLRPLRTPIQTCRTPWEPHIDAVTEVLYIPCARDDRLDAYHLQTLERFAGAPFLTGRYPLAVATWHRGVSSVRY